MSAIEILTQLFLVTAFDFCAVCLRFFASRLGLSMASDSCNKRNVINSIGYLLMEKDHLQTICFSDSQPENLEFQLCAVQSAYSIQRAENSRALQKKGIDCDVIMTPFHDTISI